MEPNIYSFGEMTAQPSGGSAQNAHERIGHILDIARPADAGGSTS